MRTWSRALVPCIAAALLLRPPFAPRDARAQTPAPETFASRIASLSEPGGYFDTDNLISNERSYLHVMPDLAAARLRGGAYIGVGPDQNFSYIAQIRPSVAFIIDIRRDNLLLHLLFKALFTLARTRVDYLALLVARPAPGLVAGWDAKPLEAIVAYVDAARPLAPADVTAMRARVTATIKTFGVPLSAADLDTIDRFHRQFIAGGLSLQFHTAGRAPQRLYPTYRDLLLETDRAGQRRSYLASEDDYQFLKSLEARDLVIPVVGDLSGPSALVAIGRWLGAHHETLSAFYTSNVEFYLFRDGTFARFAANLAKIPHAIGALLIRSFFDGSVPTLPGYGSASVTQPVQDLLDGVARGQVQSYWDLATWQRRGRGEGSSP